VGHRRGAAKEQCQRAHFWVLVAPERHVLYRLSHKHDSAAVDRLLAGYKGHLAEGVMLPTWRTAPSSRWR